MFILIGSLEALFFIFMTDTVSIYIAVLLKAVTVSVMTLIMNLSFGLNESTYHHRNAHDFGMLPSDIFIIDKMLI